MSTRLEVLQDNCREHFEEEDRNAFPLLEAVELSKEQQKTTLNGCITEMQGTHSHLFRFFMEVLQPHEVVQYMDLIIIAWSKTRLRQCYADLTTEEASSTETKGSRMVTFTGTIGESIVQMQSLKRNGIASRKRLKASMNQELNQTIPHFSLPPKILCSVVHIELKDDKETDEVYARITLIPESDERD